MARGALSLPEGAEIVSRAAARLCERPWSLPTRPPAPAGPENQGGPAAPTAGRSCAPPGAGRCFWPDRWRRSRGSLAARLAIGGPAGPGRQKQFFSESKPNISLPWGASCLNRKPDAGQPALAEIPCILRWIRIARGGVTPRTLVEGARKQPWAFGSRGLSS